MYGLDTTGFKRKTVLFMTQRSCIILYSLLGFNTGKVAVFHGERHGTDYKDMFQKFIYEELDASLGFWLREYWHLLVHGYLMWFLRESFIF